MNEPTVPPDPHPPAEDNLQRVVVVMTHLDHKDPQKSLGRNYPIFGQCGITTGPDGSLTIGSHGRAVAIYAPGQWKMAQEVIVKKPTTPEPGETPANVEAFPQPPP